MRVALVLAVAASVSLWAGRASACPQDGEGVVVEAGRLRVPVIQFDLYGPSLDPASLPIIDAVARRMIACPELVIELQVHTDTRRMTAFNARQSQAIAVLIRDRLIARGVAAARVTACGLGESQPPPGREGWDPLNNRVEWWRVGPSRAPACQRQPT